MKKIILIVTLILVLFPAYKVNAEDINMESGTKISGTYVNGEEKYYCITAGSGDYIAITIKTSTGQDLIFDILDSTRQIIASNVTVPNKETVYHRAEKGKVYYINVKGTGGLTYTLSYKMKSIDKMKYAKKYNYIITNASFNSESNALSLKIKTNYAGILQLMFETNNDVNVKFTDKKKKSLSGICAVNEHAFAGIGVSSNKTVYAKIWNGTGTTEGTSIIKGIKYQIDSVTTKNGGSKSKARNLSKRKYLETLVVAGKTTTSWYKIKVNKKQKVSFTVESRMLQNNGKNLQLYICNSSGKKLNTNPILIDGETAVIYNKKYKMEYPVKTFGTTAQFPEGTYYLKVESKTKTSSGSYRIKWE